MHVRLKPVSASDPTAAVGREPAAAPVHKRPVLVWSEQLDLLIHALAQLPDALTLEVEAPRPELGVLELLAGAYGVDGRVTFQESEGRRLGALFRPDLCPSGSAIRPGSTMADVIERVSRPEDPPASLRALDVALANQRIAVVTNLATHYRVPLFNEMAGRLASVGASFCVFLLSDIPRSRAWMRVPSLHFDHELVDSIDISRDRGRRLIPLNLEGRLAAFKPTIVLSAGFSPIVSGRVARFARRRRIPFGVWSGEISSRSTAKSRLRRVQRVRLARHATFGVAYGWESARYLRSLLPDLPIVIGRNTSRSPEVADHFNHAEAIELLTVGRAQKGKALDVLVDAVVGLDDLPCRLTLVGDGPELPRLKTTAEASDRVRFLGAVPFADLGPRYAEAEVFLFASQFDVFGLALVEAMGTGLCVLVSGAVGAVADLCVDGHNCVIIHDHNPRVWAEAIRRVVEDADLRWSLGENARRTIERRWTIAHSADAMIAGLRLAVLQVEEGGRNGE